MSSRPENEFLGWQDFTVWEISDLTLEKACELVNKPKIPFDPQLKKRFVKDLKDRLFEQHKSFLSNPLLLSIMLLTYEERADIPTKLSLFYQQAYEVLFQKHDALKPDFTRPRYTKLDIRDFERVFSAFSIQSFNQLLQTEFSKTQALNYINNCKKLQIINSDFNSEEYLNDAREAVCLLIDDGLSIKYTHRSFQEYFVAKFIAEAKEEVQEKLILRYSWRMQSDGVIPLLFEMNPDVVERFLFLPTLRIFFKKLDVVNKVELAHYPDFLRGYISGMIFNKKTNEIEHFLGQPENLLDRNYLSSTLFFFIFNSYHSLLMSEFQTELSKLKPAKILWQEFRLEPFKLGRTEDTERIEIQIDEFFDSPKAIQALAHSNSYYGLMSLRFIYFVKNILEEKHSKKDATLESILNL